MDNPLINPESITDKIKDRIKAAFLEVIPDDAWHTLIEQEINAFFNIEIRQYLIEGERSDGRDSWSRSKKKKETKHTKKKKTKT